MGLKEVVFILAPMLGIFLSQKKGLQLFLYFSGAFLWYSATPDWGMLHSVFNNITLGEISIFIAMIMALVRGRVVIDRNMYFFFALLMLTLMPIYYSDYIDYEFEWLVARKSLIFPVIGYIVAYSLLNTQNELKNFAFAIIFGASILAFIVIFSQIGLFGNPLGEAREFGAGAYRLYASYNVPIFGQMRIGGNITPIYLSFGAAFLTTFLVFKKIGRNYIQRFILKFILLVMLLAIMSTGSRTPFFALIVSIVYILFFLNNTFMKKILLLIVFTVTAYLLIDIGARIGFISQETIGRFSSIATFIFSPIEYIANSTRATAWSEFYNTILHHPSGVGFIRDFYSITGSYVSPHSQYMMIPLGMGVIGGFIYFYILYKPIVKSFFYKDKNLLIVGYSAALLTYLVNAFMIHTYQVSGVDIIAFMLSAIIHKLLRIRSNNVQSTS